MVENLEVRTRYGLLSGVVGIIVNTVLFIAKLSVGRLANSIAITADAINNLSDAGASVVNLVGFKLAGKSADDEHPFGHGRIEYISALIVSFLILLMGIELVKSSIERIINPKVTTYSVYFILILIASIVGKLWLAFFNSRLSKKIDSPVMEAVVADSLGDTAATGITLISLVLSRYISFPIDGYMGVAVAIFVFIAGVNILRETVGPLLGEPMDYELAQKIEDRITSYEGVVGAHDLMLHNYGPGRNFGSVHAEVPSDGDLLQSHDTIDLIEKNIKAEFGIDLVIHLDPIVVNDERINFLREQTKQIIKSIDEDLSIHDFRVVDGPTHTNLIFDLVVPHGYQKRKNKLVNEIDQKLSEFNERYYAVITVESSFIKKNTD